MFLGPDLAKFINKGTNMPEDGTPQHDDAMSDLTAAIERAAADQSQLKYVLTLYVTGMRPRSQRAIDNIQRLCEEHLSGRYELQVIDIYQQPALAQDAQIVAAPTLVKQLPPPLRRIIGDMSDDGRVLVALGVKMPEDPKPPAQSSQSDSL
jgi:circadian clock protein KaiB